MTEAHKSHLSGKDCPELRRGGSLSALQDLSSFLGLDLFSNVDNRIGMAPLKHFISMTSNCLLCCFSFPCPRNSLAYPRLQNYINILLLAESQ